MKNLKEYISEASATISFAPTTVKELTKLLENITPDEWTKVDVSKMTSMRDLFMN